MIRTVVLRALLFVLPFALYALYLMLQFRGGAQRPATPWTMLFVVGLGLVAVSFVIVGLTEGGPVNGTYVPAHLVNGQVVPGHTEKTP